jgi:phosphogluconate dehydratase
MTHPVVTDVTRRLVERSADSRAAYLDRIRAAARQGPARGGLGCANAAHGFAASGADKDELKRAVRPNVAIVSSYNDMLSAHQPFAEFPEQIKDAVRDAGGVAQFAGKHSRAGCVRA